MEPNVLPDPLRVINIGLASFATTCARKAWR